jgi:uncharacterized protein (DUF3084 family)
MASGGYILILAVLILGGVIATLGDRIGTKVGKARLSLFNMRPKKTAVFVTVITGVMIAASTLGVLLLASRGFRDMLLKFDSIRSDLDRTQKDLTKAKTDITKSGQEKQAIESELGKSRAKSRQVQNTLNKLETSLKNVVARQKETEARRQAIELQSRSLKAEIENLEREQQELTAQRDQVREQIGERDRELAARSGELAERDRQIQSKQAEIQSRQAIIGEREESLKKLQLERDRLMRESIAFNTEIGLLQRERNFLLGENSAIRQKLPALPVNKVLSSAIIEADLRDPKMAADVLIRLLQDANSYAFRETKPGLPINRNILNLQPNSPELEGLIRRLSSGAPYILQIRSAGNYFLGEDIPINVQIILVPRQEIFAMNAPMAGVTIDPRQLSRAQIQEKISQLIPIARSRLIQKGWLSDVGNEGIDTSQVPSLREFVDQLEQRSDVIEIIAITTKSIYPETQRIPIALLALQSGNVILDTRTFKASQALQP